MSTTTDNPLHRLTPEQIEEIGKAFGGRDHSTVIHSLDRVNTDLQTNAELGDRINRIRSQLRNL